MKSKSFIKRVVFFEQISCKTHFLARQAYNLAKGSFLHKMKSSTVLNRDLYSLSRFHAKRSYYEDILKVWQKVVFNTK